MRRPPTAKTKRARLYLDASRLLSEGYDSARADLQSLAAVRLDRSDAALLAAVRNVAVKLRTALSLSAVDAQAGASGQEPGADQTIEHAEEALKRTESMASIGAGALP